MEIQQYKHEKYEKLFLSIQFYKYNIIFGIFREQKKIWNNAELIKE